MDVSSIYVHDGTLIRVVEEPEQARLTMEVELPILPQEARLEPRLLLFEDVYGYQVAEGCINGCPTLLDLSVVGQEGRWTRVRLDTTVGHREILCASVRVCERHEKAEPDTAPKGGPTTAQGQSKALQGPPSVS
jgi:hypothetical protein